MRLSAVAMCVALLVACGSSQRADPDSPESSRPLPSLTTALPRPVLATIASKYMLALRKCAHTIIQKDKKAAGVYRIEFQVADDGKTTLLDVSGRSRPLISCLEGLVRTWVFAPILDANNKPVTKTLTLPVSFKPPAKLDQVADSNMIAVINKQYMAGIHDCHKVALKVDRKAVGRVKLQFLVNVDGTVTIANVMGIANVELLACIRAKVLTWRLPPPKGDDGKATTKSVGITVVLSAEAKKVKPATQPTTQPTTPTTTQPTTQPTR